MEAKLTVEGDGKLLEYLYAAFPTAGRQKVKSWLANRQVRVNGVVTTQFNEPLRSGDTVEVTRERAPEEFRHPMIRIVYEDDYIIVTDKRNGLLSVGTDKERTKTAFYLMSDYVKRADPRNRIFIVHRLDRETSGLMMFAKSEDVQSRMQRSWATMVCDRRYVAVVEGQMPSPSGVIDAPLVESPVHKVYVAKEGDRAVTGYEVLTRGHDYSLVELTLETGRKNQIRAHMEYLRCPIAGDKRYNAATNPAGRVCLHARVLNIIHPITGEHLDFSTRIPQLFEDVAAGRKVKPREGYRRAVPHGKSGVSGKRK